MAETFLAERHYPAGAVRRVCLKRILPQMSSDPEWVRFFQREARIVAQLEHPNIVGVHEVGETNGVWWMSLDLVEGTNLRSVMATLAARGELVPRDVVFYVVTEVANALAHAHGRAGADGAPLGIVHRDATPANILVSREGAVKLADFGIARMANDERTRTGVQRGKTPYLSPEQAQGDPVDHRADLFSLGIVFFELLTGTRPFDAKTDLATAMNIAKGARLRLPGDTTPYLRMLVNALLQTDPAKRMDSAKTLLRHLEPLAPPPSASRRLADLAADHAVEPDYELTSMDVFELAQERK